MFRRINIIINSKELCETLENMFDFKIVCSYIREEDYLYKTNTPCFIFATDGGGNTFSFVESNSEQSSVLYVDHEGRSAVIANGLEELLTYIIKYPYNHLCYATYSLTHSNEETEVFIEKGFSEIINDIPELNDITKEIATILNIDLSKYSYKDLAMNLTKDNPVLVTDLNNNIYDSY